MALIEKKRVEAKKISPVLVREAFAARSTKRTVHKARTEAVLKIKAPKTQTAKRSAKASAGILSFADIYSAQPSDRIKIIRNGVPANYVVYISKSMGITRESLFNALGLPRSTIERKVTNNQALPPEQGERVIGMAKLVGQVQVMVEQSGESSGFDAAEWVAHWMDSPSPALGGDTPASYMDTVEGQELVSSLIAKMQSGAYA